MIDVIISVIDDDISRNHNLLVEFCVYFQYYYGQEQMTYKIHLAAIRVQNLGLLRMHDTFGFENENRLLLKSKTSPTHVAVQVVKCFLFYKSILTFSLLFTIGNRVIKLTQSFENQLKDFFQMNECILPVIGKEYIFSEQEKQLSFINSCLVLYKK